MRKQDENAGPIREAMHVEIPSMSEAMVMVTCKGAKVVSADFPPNLLRRRSSLVAKGTVWSVPNEPFYVLIGNLSNVEMCFLKGMLVAQGRTDIMTLTIIKYDDRGNDTVNAVVLYCRRPNWIWTKKQTKIWKWNKKKMNYCPVTGKMKSRSTTGTPGINLISWKWWRSSRICEMANSDILPTQSIG